MNIQQAKELMGLNPKSSFSLTDAMIAIAESMAGSAKSIGALSGRMFEHTTEIAVAFYQIVISAPKELRYEVWTDTRKFFQSICVKTHGLNEDTVRKYMTESINLLKPEGEGIQIDGKTVTLVKPAKPTKDAQRMSAKRKELHDKFDGKADDTLKATHDELIKSGELADTQEAALFAKELADRVDAKVKANEVAERKARTEYNQAIRGNLVEASDDARPVANMLLNPQGSKQIAWADEVIANWKETFSNS